ncbi:7-carboxy-7-deazaguanine synthase QueE [Thiohalobacter thiocyanaticus]|uniref:7-carboxy-7-deazaguanine synthase n=1 Tax=Thiohalobacter thiocyanaticus TaxID=585455 RepID=A0A426QHC4_9GAMM|nr:7-carboxy-7-deazaguanine synthase QueE [Thiohalobacter thiocyanaticus]RRQ21165.1 7-carboxy-7-deazaguanine synthase QueE [Thiohalobacter thiocyanaticus]
MPELSTPTSGPAAGDRLRITEIFHSLQGEADTVGWPTVFVRLTGCPLRCHYCDTEYAFHGGEWMDLGAILTEVGQYGARHVTVTGGEPLAQKACRPLLTRLCDAGYRVSLETSGALDIDRIDPRVIKVVDLKTPGSGEVERNRYCVLEHMSPDDQIKFVLCDRADYDWAREKLTEYDIPAICQVLFSPVWGRLAPRDLADWILADRLPVRFQVQLHKLLWGDVPGR